MTEDTSDKTAAHQQPQEYSSQGDEESTSGEEKIILGVGRGLETTFSKILDLPDADRRRAIAGIGQEYVDAWARSEAYKREQLQITKAAENRLRLERERARDAEEAAKPPVPGRRPTLRQQGAAKREREHIEMLARAAAAGGGLSEAPPEDQ